MFTEERSVSTFTWADIGDLEAGRPHLGPKAPLLAYRLLQYTWRDVMITELGVARANAIVVAAGRLAGKHFCTNLLDCTLPFGPFMSALQQLLKDEGIGILRVEHADVENLRFTLTVAEDLDCSGLPSTDERVCQYDEGFIAGILETYAGRPFVAREVDCWASGDRVCRFDVQAVEDGAG